MRSPTEYVINSFMDKLIEDYTSLYGQTKPNYPKILYSVGKLALNTIAKGNAAYHDVHHTIMVADVGQDILKGKHILENNISPSDWFHFIIAALYHDIGYIRGLCDGDKEGEYIKNLMGDTVHLPSHSTDAALAPYHIDRAKLYSRAALNKIECIDHDFISNLIERTRFPVPSCDKYKNTGDLPGLLRAADLIGQVADINYTKRSDALFSELEEIGSAKKLGYKTGYDLRVKLPVFFKTNVSPYVKEAINYLDVTNSGKRWITNLFMNILTENPYTGGKTGKNSPYQGTIAKEPHASPSRTNARKIHLLIKHKKNPNNKI